MNKNKGLIYNIQRFSIYDGPGARTVVFFKGCNLHCWWCHNPESISGKRQLLLYPEKCIGCGECFHRCPQGAHGIDAKGLHRIDRDLCAACFDCVDHCYAEALVSVGQEVDIAYLKKAIMTDLPYYRRSGGGVTFSGGECMLQIGFLREMLTVCREASIHTAVDTAGHVDWSYFERILDVTDLFLYDLKAADSEVHKDLTGVSNERIIANLKKLSDLHRCIHVRIPLIPGANDGEIEGIAKLLTGLRVEQVTILPYHTLGVSKNESLGNTPHAFTVPAQEAIDRALEILASYHIQAKQNTGV